jgi:hypothetical protein
MSHTVKKLLFSFTLEEFIMFQCMVLGAITEFRKLLDLVVILRFACRKYNPITEVHVQPDFLNSKINSRLQLS